MWIHVSFILSFLIDLIKSQKFPTDFLIGAASASYQTEGGWNLDGKGESIWDHTLHTLPNFTVDGTNGDVACDSYHKYKEDVRLLKNVGFQMYRFSISWPRILPTGDFVNKKGIEFYRNLINELLANEIIPMVTIYHWDLPYKLHELGGWTNPLIVKYFEKYAEVLFQHFGDQVKWWITINEPGEICIGYNGGRRAPFISQPGVADYLAGHHMLIAHARAYRLYDTKFRRRQNGKVSISISASYFTSRNNLKIHRLAVEKAEEFQVGWFANPIYSKEGDYPSIMRTTIDANSLKEGRLFSRLPKFTNEEIELIKGSADFFAVNHYSSYVVLPESKGPAPSIHRDANITYTIDSSWEKSKAPWLHIVPEGFRKLLKSIKKKYNNVPIFVTENGYCDGGELEDYKRIRFHELYIQAMLQAVYNDGCNVIGYIAWAIVDNLEWEYGLTMKFGIHHVDFDDPERKRTPKKSAEFFKKIIEEWKLSIPIYRKM